MERVFFNNTIYHISGKSIYKFDMRHQTKAIKIDKEEKRKVLEFILSQNNITSKSSRLNQILKENSQLTSIEGIEHILKIVEACIPKSLRETFYDNLKTAQIYFLECFEIEKTDRGGEYNVIENKIVIYTPEHIKCLNFPNASDIYRYAVQTALIHELFHLASSRYDSENNIIRSGFKYSISSKKEIIQQNYNNKKVLRFNTFLNEGFTEFLEKVAEKFLYGSDLYNRYLEELSIIMQLTNIIDISVIEKSYFCQLGTSLIQQKLSKIINDPAKAEYLIVLLDNIKEDKEINYKYLLKAENIVIDYLGDVVRKLISNGLIEQANHKYKAFLDSYKMIFSGEKFRKATIPFKDYIDMENELRRKLELIKKENNIDLSRVKK